jgi:hypothetical protein
LKSECIHLSDQDEDSTIREHPKCSLSVKHEDASSQDVEC